jgi:hypothetical protein
LGLFGWNFRSSATTRVAVQPLSGEALDPTRALFQLTLVNVQPNLIQGVLPVSIPPDLYAVWINNGLGWSSPAFVNRAEVFWASESQVYAGQPVRLIGRNFSNPRTGDFTALQVNVVAVNGQGSFAANITQSGDYAIDFTIPSQVRPGLSYTVQVSNGAGGASGWTQMEDQAFFTAVAVNGNMTAINSRFHVNAAWVGDIPAGQSFNVTRYGALGNGTTNDTAAIQSALNAAANAGGGIIEFPAGAYRSATLTIPPDTVLHGAGANATTLTYLNLTPAAYSVFITATGTEIGFADLSVVNTTQRPPALNGTVLHPNTSPYVSLINLARSPNLPAAPGYFFENVDLHNADGFGIAARYSPVDLIVEGSTIASSEVAIYTFDPAGHLRIRNNQLSNTSRPLLALTSVPHQSTFALPYFAWIESNTFTGRGCIANTNQVGCAGVSGADFGEHRILDGFSSFCYIAHNASQGEFGSHVKDGEGLGFQSNQRFAYSTASGAGASTLTDASQSFAAGSLMGAKVAIIGGAGIGQLRTITSNSAYQLTIDQPWEVIPDNTSIYTVDPYVTYHNIIVNNKFQAVQTGAAIQIYTKSYDNVIAGNVVQSSAGITFSANQVPSQKRADFAYFNYIGGNSITGGSDPLSDMPNVSFIGNLTFSYANDALHSTAAYGSEIRGNTLSGVGTSTSSFCGAQMQYLSNCNRFGSLGGIFFSSIGSPVSYPFAQGTLVERNTITDSVAGVHLLNTTYDTLLKENNLTGDGVAVDDQGSVRTVTYLPVPGPLPAAVPTPPRRP